MRKLSAQAGSEGYEACDDERPLAALPSSPRDNLCLIKNFKNPETATVSGFSLCIEISI